MTPPRRNQRFLHLVNVMLPISYPPWAASNYLGGLEWRSAEWRVRVEECRSAITANLNQALAILKNQTSSSGVWHPKELATPRLQRQDPWPNCVVEQSWKNGLQFQRAWLIWGRFPTFGGDRLPKFIGPTHPTITPPPSYSNPLL
jgi:hypothetical protein